MPRSELTDRAPPPLGAELSKRILQYALNTLSALTHW
jgi:hypothetical protein